MMVDFGTPTWDQLKMLSRWLLIRFGREYLDSRALEELSYLYVIALGLRVLEIAMIIHPLVSQKSSAPPWLIPASVGL